MTLSDSFLVSEIYPCLQGEGKNLGKPSILVRLQICNLRCKWCDTPYTHTMTSDPVSAEHQGRKREQNFKRLSISEIAEKIRSFDGIRHVILSGGEPTLQNLSLIFDRLKADYSIEVESNGTQIPHLLHSSFMDSHYKDAQWNISPKGNNAGQKIEAKPMRHWSELAKSHPDVFFKFVIRRHHQDADLAEAEDLINTYGLPRQKIIVMAEGTTVESQLNNDWLETVCMHRGWTLSPRLHVLNHGSKRGV
ncbi:MAG: 7-carboxy-7-deazaguanine synthase QueE [Proteobacteria bacterium]|nr:7-carboxy-7-deazaguanine synthase QueE [Pseudomonadota bacterium]